jgi:hypothetical protein
MAVALFVLRSVWLTVMMGSLLFVVHWTGIVEMNCCRKCASNADIESHRQRHVATYLNDLNARRTSLVKSADSSQAAK